MAWPSVTMFGLNKRHRSQRAVMGAFIGNSIVDSAYSVPLRIHSCTLRLVETLAGDTSRHDRSTLGSVLTTQIRRSTTTTHHLRTLAGVNFCESTPSGHVDSWISCCVACFCEEGDGVPVLVQHAVISGPITKATAVHPSIHPFHPFIRAYPLAHARPTCSDASRVPLRRSTELVPRPHGEGDAPARGGDAPHSPAARAARRASTLLSSHLAHSLVYLSRPLSSLSPRSLFPSSQGRARVCVCVCVCVCMCHASSIVQSNCRANLPILRVCDAQLHHTCAASLTPRA